MDDWELLASKRKACITKITLRFFGQLGSFVIIRDC
jgi:hypothetical protein